MMRKFVTGAALGTALLTVWSASPAQAESVGSIQHVLLISIDGMHSVDFANCAAGIAGVNNGATYSPSLAELGETGANFNLAQTSTLAMTSALVIHPQ
jgi:hypothetical protein